MAAVFSSPPRLPHIVSGTKQDWAFVWRSLMAAEISVAILGGFGIGHLLHHGPELQAMDQLVGQMRVMAAIGFLGDELIFYP